jgi:predicted ABC-class ATPase
VMMRGYAPLEVTEAAREAARLHPTGRRQEGSPWQPLRERVPDPDSLDPRRGRREVEVKASVRERVRFGEDEIELSAVEQLVEAAQTRAVGRALAWLRGRHLDGRSSLARALRGAERELEEGGLDLLDERLVGDYAEFRVFELAAALNRLRTLRLL